LRQNKRTVKKILHHKLIVKHKYIFFLGNILFL